ncbi:MAG: SMC-Scp complex subunit ScpB [Actinomycetota bacterium]|nr:SMC-Scp complex subunit ScpB [Actinomycetota bacterium]
MDEDRDARGAAGGLAATLEALILVASEPVTLAQLSRASGASESDCELAMGELLDRYADPSFGIEIASLAGGYRFVTKSVHHGALGRFAEETFEARLSPAALETLAIVAYQQPISRRRVSAIRGVNSDAVMRMLAVKGYIHPVGRENTAGSAVLFATTALFLERLGLPSLADLPALAQFEPSVEVAESIEAALREEA